MKALSISLFQCLFYACDAAFDIPAADGVTTREAPFVASLSTVEGHHFCAGSLISPTQVLTAAHCMSGSTDFRVTFQRWVLSAPKGHREEHTVSSVHIHPGYDPCSMAHDLAVVELDQPSTVHPVRIGSIPIEWAGHDASVYGWGALYLERGNPNLALQNISTKIVTNEECRLGYGNVHESMLCAGMKDGQDSCQGDSGAPLVVRVAEDDDFYQIGTVSWGAHCEQRKRYGVHARVSWAEVNEIKQGSKRWVTAELGTRNLVSDDTLLAENFVQTNSALGELGWHVVDETKAIQGPSSWKLDTDGQEVRQERNIRSEESHTALEKRGTHLLYTRPLFDSNHSFGHDYSLGAQMSSEDNDVLGFIVRYEDEGNFLRVSFDRQRSERSEHGPYARLVQFVDGSPLLLDGSNWRYDILAWYDVEIIVVGQFCHVYVNGNRMLESDRVPVPSSPSSTIGLYSHANRGSAFSTLRVTKRSQMDSKPFYHGISRHATSTPLLSFAETIGLKNDEDMEEQGGVDSKSRLAALLVPICTAFGALCATIFAAVLILRRRKSTERRRHHASGLGKQTIRNRRHTYPSSSHAPTLDYSTPSRPDDFL